jgi:hypothetical protein
VAKEVYKDEGLKTGVCAATLTTVLKAKDVDFKVIAAENRLIKNVSDGSTGTVRSTTFMDQQGYSTLTATLTGGTVNKFYTGATYTLYITDTANKKISSTEVGFRSGLAYPKDQMVEGDLPGWEDIDQQTMTTHRKQY